MFIQVVIEKLAGLLHDKKMKRGGDHDMSELEKFYNHPFSKKSEHVMLHPDPEDEGVMLPSEESNDSVLETRVLR